MQFMFYIKRIIRMFAYNRLIPYKLRKPLIMVSSIIGLLFFYNFILRVTDSIYLHQIDGWLYPYLYKNISITVIILCMIVLMSFISHKYYKQIQMVIAVLYIIVLFLGVLGFMNQHQLLKKYVDLYRLF